MPGLGDFFRAGLPRSFVEPWDRWLQETILALKTSMADGWTTAYLSAPIWRFTLSAGLIGPDPVQGVCMASVDRVGRQFPLTLARILPEGADVPLCHVTAMKTFQSLEDIALASLDDDMNRESLEQKLEVVPVSSFTRGVITNRAQTLCVQTSSMPAQELAANAIARRFRAPSLWTAELPDGARLMTCEGMPGAVQARGLYDLSSPIWQAEEHAE